MATLYKRATPSQRKILRIVKGAVLNEADAHGRKRDEIMARSIAKRAAGTLTAQMRDVLALDSPTSVSNDVAIVAKIAVACEQQSEGDHLVKHPTPLIRARGQRGPSKVVRRSPLMRLRKQLSSQMRGLRESGQIERYEAYKEVLRQISKMQKEGLK